MLFLILVILLILGLCSPYIAVVIKRRKMLRGLVAFAAENGYRTKPLHRFVCLSPNRGRKYDLIIQNKAFAYPVKLWSTAKRSSTLVVRKNGQYYETYGVDDPMKTDKAQRHTVKGIERTARPTQENFKVRVGKTVTPILLFYPCNNVVLADLGDSRRKIEPGEKIFRKTLCTPATLRKILSENAAPQAKIGTGEKERLDSGVR